MVRKKFDRTVVKKCPKCEEQVPVACKFCTCGHPFASRNKLLLKEEAEEAMGILDRPDLNKDEESPMDRLRRPRRLSRDKPTYYVITELNRQVKRARQKVKPASSTDMGAVGELVIPKRKKRGRPRGSGARTKTRRKTILKQQASLQLQQPKQEPLILQLPKQERLESLEQDSPQATSSSSSSSSSSSPHTPPSQSYYHQLQEMEFSDTKLATSPTPALSIATSSGIDRKLNLSSCSATSNNFGNNPNSTAASASSNTSSTGEISIKIDNRTSFSATTPSPPLSSTSSSSTSSLSATAAAANSGTTGSKNKGGTIAAISSSSGSTSNKNSNNTNNNNNNNMMIINNAMHSKDNNNSNSSINSVSSNSSNSTITTNYGTKNISNSDSNSVSISNINTTTTTNNNNNNNNSNNSNNNSSSSSNNNNNTSNNSGAEKDMYSNISPEKALQFYAILADLNRKIISQSFKPW